MITARGWWFLLVVLPVLTLGAFGGRLTLTLVALTLLFWFLGEWLLFVLRVHWGLGSLRVRRMLADERGPVATLWAGRSFRVQVEIRLTGRLGIPYVRIAEFLPLGAEKTEGQAGCDTALADGEPVMLHYSIRWDAPGRARFEGLMVQMTDFQGFFHFSTFVPSVAVYRVLPPLADAEGRQPTVKRRNLLPAPGLHRHLRPGSGSELLDLRDYLPGDPPKTIAWKVSARRDRLISKDFESEVPIRSTLFVDTSQSVRIGAPGQNALARIVEIASAVAQATAGIRDYTGLCLFDEEETIRYIRPARGASHLSEILNLLADAAGLAPASGSARVTRLLPTAYAFVNEVYPHLLRPEINFVPGLLSWLAPAHTFDRPRFAKTRFLVRWLVIATAFLPLALLDVLAYVLADVINPAFVPEAPAIFALIGAGLFVSTMVLYYSLATLAYGAVGRFFTRQGRRRTLWRKRLAAVLAGHYRLGPGGIGILLEDDEKFVVWAERFLAEHQVPYPVPLYDAGGRYLFASPGKVDVLAQALLRAIVRVRDNELFVLFVDLLELVDRLEPLLRAVKVTLARHHRVLVICPWPPGIASPGRCESGGQRTSTSVSTHISAGMEQLTAAQLLRAFQRLRRSFAKIGVPVVSAAGGDPARLILARLNQLRTLGLGRK